MNYAVILAGGIGSRMRSDGFPKQYVEIQGKPVLVYTLECFEACADVDKIVVVSHCQWKEKIVEWGKQFVISKLSCIAQQGETRQESVLNGLLACENMNPGKDDVVLIHDAARPLITTELISRCVDESKRHDACLPVISAKDTIYYSVDGISVSGLTDRATLFCGQSPECFNLLRYLRINKKTPKEKLQQVRGCCELAFQAGFDIGMIPGDEMNFKLTTQEDMDKLRAILAAKK